MHQRSVAIAIVIAGCAGAEPARPRTLPQEVCLRSSGIEGCIRACYDHDDVDSCLKLAKAYAWGRHGVTRDFERASRIWRRLCRDDRPRRASLRAACEGMANKPGKQRAATSPASPTPGNPPPSRPPLGNPPPGRCSPVNIPACMHQASRLEGKARKTRADWRAVFRLYRVACRAKHAMACSSLGDLYRRARRVNSTYIYRNLACKLGRQIDCRRLEKLRDALLFRRYRRLLRRARADRGACNRGDQRACIRYGIAQIVHSYRGGLRNHLYGFSVLKLTYPCTKGMAVACRALGLVYFRGYGKIRADQARARSYYNKACRLGDNASCYQLGMIHQLGEGMPSNLSRALAYFDIACRRGSRGSCYAAGYALAHGRSPQGQRAAAYIKRACELNDARACRALAAIFRTGRLVRRDLRKARYYYDAACRLGDRRSCSPKSSRAR